jgi:hypothetical protein
VNGEPFVDVEINQPITDQIQNGKAVGRVGIGVDIDPHGIFADRHRERGLGISGLDPRLDLRKNLLGFFV